MVSAWPPRCNRVLAKGIQHDRICTELSIHRLLSTTNHPHILPVIDVAKHSNELYIIMERAKCDLYDLIESSGGLSEDIARPLILELVSALQLCHNNGVFHRDIKPENVLVDFEGHLKLTDFGFAFVGEPDTELRDRVGTEAYAAPEVLDRDTPSYQGGAVDVWSLGVCLFIMTSCCFPFKCASSRCEFFRTLMQGEFKFPEAMSLELQSLLLCMWELDPQDRITLPEIRQHEWFEVKKPAMELD